MMNKNYYDISYATHGVQMLTTNLREELVISFIKAIMTPLDDLHAQFMKLKDGIDYKNYSQVCYMQGIINDHFDPLERRIKIKNCHVDRDSYLYWKENINKPVETFKEETESFIFRIENGDFQIGTTNIDFEVVLPKGFRLSDEEDNRMRNIVNQSKLASKQYRITNGQD